MSNRTTKRGEEANIRVGKFTPRYQDDSFTDKTETYDTDVTGGTFTRIGNRVFFDLRIKIGGSLGTMVSTNALHIVQLPFAIGALSIGSGLMGQGVGLDMPTVGQPITVRMDPLTNSMQLMVLTLATGHTPMQVTHLTTAGDIKVSGHYETDDA